MAGHGNKGLTWSEHEIFATERPRVGCITHVDIQNTKSNDKGSGRKTEIQAKIIKK